MLWLTAVCLSVCNMTYHNAINSTKTVCTKTDMQVFYVTYSLLHGFTSEAVSLFVGYNGLRNTWNFIAFYKTPLVGGTPNSFSVYIYALFFLRLILDRAMVQTSICGVTVSISGYTVCDFWYTKVALGQVSHQVICKSPPTPHTHSPIHSFIHSYITDDI